MCGFAGVLSSVEPINAMKVRKAASLVSHRGPDASGFAFFNQSWEATENDATHAFFFNRLAIVDLDSRSNQPFQDDQHLLVFNGEIYNYKDLRDDLKKHGVVFRTSSDTEVLFFALKIWGNKAIGRLNGMFAFFWIDKKTNRFILARDRIGIKTIYYKKEGRSLIFASELQSIVRLAKDPPKVASQALTNYLWLQYVPTPFSIFQEIYKLPPGNVLDSSLQQFESNDAIASRSFWDAYEQMSPDNTKDLSDRSLEEILAASIKRQLEADVSVGLFLSSGVDSSLLTAVINKHFNATPYNFFTVGFDDVTDSDESESAASFLKGFKNPNLHHHKLTVNPAFIASKLSRLYDYFDEPFGDPAALLNWSISEKAKDFATVVLSGDGADELFWGYPRYDQWATESRRVYKSAPGLSSAENLLTKLPESRVKYTLLGMLEKNPAEIYFNILRPRLFGFLPPITANKSLWGLNGLSKFEQRNDLPAIMDVKGYLPDAMLYKVDRASMAASLEVRVPYLDNDVIDFALGLPLACKSNYQFQNKAPLKKLLASLAPHYEINKPKKGFNFPLREWLKTDWREMVLDLSTKENFETLGLPSGHLLKILHNFYYRDSNSVSEIWYLFNLMLWFNNSRTLKKMPSQ